MRKYPFTFEVDYGSRKEKITIRTSKDQANAEKHLKIMHEQGKVLGWKRLKS